MGKQFSILLTAVDLQKLDDILRASGDVEILSAEATADDTDLLPLSAARHQSIWCYLVPVGLPRRLLLRRLSPMKVDLDQSRSHVIEYWRSYSDGTIIRRGRLWYEHTYLEQGEFVRKDVDFCRWADRVMSRARRALRYDKDHLAYLGEDAAAQIRSNNLTVVQ